MVWNSVFSFVSRAIGICMFGLIFAGLLSQGRAAVSVTMAWNPSTSPGITGYVFYSGTSSGSYPQIIDVGDTTQATISDLAVGQTYYFVVTAYNGQGLESAPSNEVSITIGPNSVIVNSRSSNSNSVNPPNFDFDGDGKQDLLWRNTSSGDVVVWLMNGSALKTGVDLGSPPFSWVIINSGDFDGHGKSDILWQLASTNQYGVWFMNGAQVAGIKDFELPSYAGQVRCAADFDGDGLTDLVTFNRSAGIIYFWKNTGSLQFVGQSSYAVSAGSGWLPVGTARLNGAGGSPALIWRNTITGEISAWFMNGFLWDSVASLGNPGPTVALSGFGDFSGDGRADLLLFNSANKYVGYWQTNGDQLPSSVPLAQVSGTWVPVGAADLDGSGKAEIIWRETLSGALGVWQVNGSTWSVYIGSVLVGAQWQLQPQPINP